MATAGSTERGRARRSIEARRVLLVDRDAMARRVLVDAVKALHVDVDAVSTVNGALVLLDRHRRSYLAAMLDVGIDDFATRALVKTLLAPAYACCAIATSDDVDRGRMAELRGGGVVRTLLRPLAREDVGAAVRETIADTLRYRARLGSTTESEGAGQRAAANDLGPMEGWLTGVCQATPKEIEIATLVRAGLSNERIADATRVSTSAVKQRLRRLLARCSVASKAELRRLLLDLFGTPNGRSRPSESVRLGFTDGRTSHG